jgi:uncharacterized protein YbjT (DUF2867 family)
VIPRLRQQFPDDELTVVLRPSSRHPQVTDASILVRYADLADYRSLERAFAGARWVVSLVSLGFGHAPNLVAAMEAVRPEHAIFFSSMSIYTKLASRSRQVRMEAERLVIESKIATTIFRPTMIYGRPGDRNIERLLRFLHWSPVVPLIGSGAGLQQPVHVDDLAYAVAIAIGKTATMGRAYNLPGPRPLRFRELIKQAASVVGRDPVLVHIPRRLAYRAVALWSTTRLWPRVRPEQVLRLEENKQADPSRAAAEFGFAPREFIEGVRLEAELLGLLAPGSRVGDEAPRLSPIIHE